MARKIIKARRKKPDAKLVILVLIIAVGVAYAILQPQQQKRYGTIEERIKAELEQAGSRTERPDYLPAIVYSKLPPFPRDFYQIDLLFRLGRLTDYADLEPRYWKQPEFYPGFEENMDLIANPQAGRFYPWGIGAYPGDIGIVASPGDEFDVTTYFHTSWLVETYQGTKMQPFFPSSIDIPKQDLIGINYTVRQDPAVVRNYFSVSADPQHVLLEPANPIFGNNWTHKIALHIKVDNNTPAGTYGIALNPASPDKQYSDAWSKKYLLSYTDISAFAASRPYFQVVVEIVPRI